MVERLQVELLNDAFNSFQEASRQLETQYARLERRVASLKKELAEKNRALERHRRLAAMGEMAAKIAHEIRNPLGSIGIFASLIEEEVDGAGKAGRYAAHIAKGVKTLDTLLGNMLVFARVPEPRLAAVDVREVLDEALTAVRGCAADGVKVLRDYRGDGLVMGDRALLSQVFVNLLINAFDAVGRSGTVRLIVRRSGADRAEIEVRDDGPGIPRDQLDRIFDPFHTTKEKGTGLGLAIVDTIVKAHRGSIDVKSRPGKGAAFIVRLAPAHRE